MHGTLSIETLVNDIERLLFEGITDVPQDVLDRFLKSTGDMLKDKLSQRKREFTLRMSNIGTPCARKLWLEKNFPEEKIELLPSTLAKFQFGDLTEEYIIFLAELSGHKVEGRQDECEIAGIKGHRDVIIDGMLVDVKSASSWSFKKFQKGLTPEEDSFGYLTQLQSYLYAARNDPLVTVKDKAAFLVFDKQHGHICLDIHNREDRNFEEFYEERKRIVDSPDIPLRKYSPVPEGKSGNEKLGPNCGYCDLRKKCWPGLRTFIYSYGPVHLTKVVREPNVPEIKEVNGKEKESTTTED